MNFKDLCKPSIFITLDLILKFPSERNLTETDKKHEDSTKAVNWKIFQKIDRSKQSYLLLTISSCFTREQWPGNEDRLMMSTWKIQKVSENLWNWIRILIKSRLLSYLLTLGSWPYIEIKVRKQFLELLSCAK